VVWVVKLLGCHCTDVFGGKDIVGCRPLSGALLRSPRVRSGQAQHAFVAVASLSAAGGKSPHSLCLARRRLSVATWSSSVPGTFPKHVGKPGQSARKSKNMLEKCINVKER